MHIGIVICSRLGSTRLPNKAHLVLENKTIISHLINNLLCLDIPIVVTVPINDFESYRNDPSLPKTKNLLIHNSIHDEDPLARTHQVAKQFSFDYVIRITHDKIFIDTDALKEAIEIIKNEKPDYLYTSNLIPGTNFEIINYKSLSEATLKYKNIEYIGYAIRLCSKKIINFNKDNNRQNIKDLSLLIDYEDDYKLFQVIYSRLGESACFKNVMDYMSKNRDLVRVNKKPLVSVYTCAYNSEKFIINAMDSVFNQSCFDDCEYILIDDHSSDRTFELMTYFSIESKKITSYRNSRNIGLSSSSNFALSKAKGKYIIRIDSDDYFAYEDAIKNMVERMEFTNSEIIYPNNYHGSYEVIQKGYENHHVGGALFNKNALNFIKFTDGLRGYEGYDLFLRAKDRLKINYFLKPIFFYTKREGSLSNSNFKFREKIKIEIEKRNGLI